MPYTEEYIRSTLLKVYSGNPSRNITDQIIASALSDGKELTGKEVQDKMESLALESLYLKIKPSLEEFKLLIDEQLEKPEVISHEQEVKTILFEVVLNKSISFITKDPDNSKYKMELLYDLVAEGFIKSGKWNEVLAKHFSYVFLIIKEWYSFFFSYTNREPYDLNKRYEQILPPGVVSTESNQVALFIAKNLYNELLPNGFTDKKEIEYGSEFKEVIDKAIKRSYAFVQIISRESFLLLGKTNWPQYEFQQYSKFLDETRATDFYYYDNALKDNIFFLVMGETLESVKPGIILTEYKDWYNKVKNTHHFRFTPQVANNNPLQPGNNFITFSDSVRALANAIIQAKKRLIDAIPD